MSLQGKLNTGIIKSQEVIKGNMKAVFGLGKIHLGWLQCMDTALFKKGAVHI